MHANLSDRWRKPELQRSMLTRRTDQQTYEMVQGTYASLIAMVVGVLGAIASIGGGLWSGRYLVSASAGSSLERSGSPRSSRSASSSSSDQRSRPAVLAWATADTLAGTGLADNLAGDGQQSQPFFFQSLETVG